WRPCAPRTRRGASATARCSTCTPTARDTDAVREIAHAPPLPIAGTTELALPVERVWAVFADVERWPDWNPCFWRASVDGGELREGATLRFAFNPIRRAFLYKLPASAELV